MRFTPALFAAAAATIAGFVRLALGDDPMHWADPADRASEIPPITEKRVEQYAYSGATDQEIADRFLIDIPELHRHFGSVLRVARALHNMTVRSCEFELAKKLNGPMLIWLGRNELGQSLKAPEANDPTPDIGINEM